MLAPTIFTGNICIYTLYQNTAIVQPPVNGFGFGCISYIFHLQFGNHEIGLRNMSTTRLFFGFPIVDDFYYSFTLVMRPKVFIG